MTKSQKDRMLAGELYLAGDPELVAMRQECKKKIQAYNRTSSDEPAQRQKLLQSLLGEMGEGCYIEPPFYVDYGSQVKLGKGVYFNMDCMLLDTCEIKIGDDVMFGPRVSVYTAHHPLTKKARLSGAELGTPVEIGDGSWIGGGAIINPGVKIGKNCVIGSGSVVVRDIPDNAIAVGNPAKVLRILKPEDEAKWDQQVADFFNELKSE